MEKNNTALAANLTQYQNSGNNGELFEKSSLIKDFIIDNFLFGDSDNLKDDTDLFKESIVDSTGILELISYLEITYKIKVNDEDIIQEYFCSINAIRNFVNHKKITTDTLCAE